MGMLSDVVGSVFQQGVPSGVIHFTNLSIGALILALLFLGFVWEFNIHVFVLLFAAGGLFVSLQWYPFLSSSLLPLFFFFWFLPETDLPVLSVTFLSC